MIFTKYLFVIASNVKNYITYYKSKKRLRFQLTIKKW